MKNTTIKNFIWRFAERCGAQLVTFIVSIVLARLLSPEDYGTIALVTVFTTILQVFVDAKMNEFQAAMGICNLRHLSDEIAKRKKVVERYRERLSGVEGIQLSAIQENVESNYAYFPVVFDGYKYTRNEVFAMLEEQGITARKYFYPLTNSFECYRNYPTAGTEKTPVAQHLALRVLTLPLYADLALEDVDRICDIILG